jgi:hypothetical protein
MPAGRGERDRPAVAWEGFMTPMLVAGAERRGGAAPDSADGPRTGALTGTVF